MLVGFIRFSARAPPSPTLLRGQMTVTLIKRLERRSQESKGL
jgi:hypothetical protein